MSDEEYHELDLDAEAGKYGAAISDQFGQWLECPNCNAGTSVQYVITDKECMQCELDMNVYATYGEPEMPD